MHRLTEVSSSRIFGGYQKVYSHESTELHCTMNFSVYLPPRPASPRLLPLLYFLSGVESNERTALVRAGFQRYASEQGIAVVSPDTSTRVRIAGDDAYWGLGAGASFYLDAAREPWSRHYRMAAYLTGELHRLVLDAFADLVDPERVGITGHCMGGHGALVSALRNPGRYKSVSAFAAVCNPSACAWGARAFGGYLGPDPREDRWADWDATELVANYSGPPLTILLDQGTADPFYLEGMLLPERLVAAAERAAHAQVSVLLALREGYDHMFTFIATFVEEHFLFHASILKAGGGGANGDRTNRPERWRATTVQALPASVSVALGSSDTRLFSMQKCEV